MHVAFQIHHLPSISDHGTLFMFKPKPTNTVAQYYKVNTVNRCFKEHTLEALHYC